MNKKQDKLFNVRWWLEPICEKLTHHKYNKFMGCDESFVEGNYKYANRHDFYYKCKICGLIFFNHHISEENLQKLKGDKE